MIGVNIFLADGFEDLEALGTNDVLLRGGVETTLVSLSDDPFAESSHGLCVGTNVGFSELSLDHSGTSERDFMIFPGGMPGSKTLASNSRLIDAMKGHYAAGGSLAAICAAPGLVLSQLDDVAGLEFTCFDSFEDFLVKKGAEFSPVPAKTCGRIITGRSAGHCLSFALEILKAIKGEDVAAKVAHDLFLQTR